LRLYYRAEVDSPESFRPMNPIKMFSRLGAVARALVSSDPIYLIAVAAYLALFALLFAANPLPLQALRFISLDTYQRIEPRSYDPRLPVRIVDIDNESLRRLGQWPWPRSLMARLVRTLSDAGAAAVAFDVDFPDPDRTSPEQIIGELPANVANTLRRSSSALITHDGEFADALSKSNSILGVTLTNDPSDQTEMPAKAGFAVAGDDPKPFLNGYEHVTANLPILDKAAIGLGALNWIPDQDGVVRRVPLLFRLNNQFVPSLAAEALRIAQGAGTYILKASNANGETAYGKATGLNHMRIGSIEVPTDADGGMWVHFRKSDPGAFLPVWKIMSGKIPAADIQGRILFIGTSAPGLVDLRATPLGKQMPGVEIHEQLLEQIILGDWLTRPDYASGVELIVTLLLGFAFWLPRHNSVIGIAAAVALVGVLFAATWCAYRYAGLLFDPLIPAGALLLQIGGTSVYLYRRTERQRAEVQRMFSQYVSPRVAQFLTEHPEKVALGGEVRELSLIFTDVRSFTSLSEGMTAHELTRLLNEMLTPLTDLIFECGDGTLDKYMGDGIMAFWNAPLDDDLHTTHACECALAIWSKMRELNVGWRKRAESEGRLYRPFEIGIGINTGPCCVGNLGSTQHYDYSAIGDNVNLTSRLEGLTRYYNLPAIIGEETRNRVSSLRFLEVDLVRVKGRSGAARIYTMMDMLDVDKNSYDLLAERHGQLYEAYRSKRWDDAKRMLAACRDFGVSSLATMHTLYEQRIEQFSAMTLPPDWDGAHTALEK
jgi:adenylate cyclase